MSIEPSTTDGRIQVLQTLSSETVSAALAAAVHALDGQGLTISDAVNKAIAELEQSGQITSKEADRLRLANNVAGVSNNNAGLVKAIDSDENVNSLRELARHYDASAIAKSSTPNPDSDVSNDAAAAVTRKLFEAEPTAILAGLVENDKIPLQNPELKPHILSILSNTASPFDITKTPVAEAAKESPETFQDVPPEKLEDTIQQVKLIQRVQAIAPTPEAIPVLVKQNLTTAFAIASTSPESFVAANAVTLGDATAREVWSNAMNTASRNENILARILDTARGTGLAVLDRVPTFASRGPNGLSSANFEALFGSNDQCNCDECTTVYSPAAYLCEILQYLRNNNLDPKKLVTDTSGSGSVSIEGTALENLLRRRPDITEIELSCDNTNVVLPYIDLANEVMESFIVHTTNMSPSSSNTPMQYTIDAFNVSGESSQDLLSQPAHLNVRAYTAISSAVYPFSLPYHQAIDAQRTFLDFLKVERVSLLDNFRSHPTLPQDSKVESTDENDKELQRLQKISLDRQVDAESLGMNLVEYVLLTHESFRPKIFYSFLQKEEVADDWYNQKIGLKSVPACYGYINADALNSMDDSARSGLMFVKNQFLQRSGVTWIDLVDIVQTFFVNPNLPLGRDLDILQSLKFSYKFLQGLIPKTTDGSTPDYTKLAEFLVANLEFPSKSETASGGAPTSDSDKTELTAELKDWADRNFKSLGNVIVLESNQGPELPVPQLEHEGYLSAWDKDSNPFTFQKRAEARGAWYLHTNGDITVTKAGSVVAKVSTNGSRVICNDDRPYAEVYPGQTLQLWDSSGTSVYAFIDQKDSVLRREEIYQGPLRWISNAAGPSISGDSNIDGVTLVHLDGSPLGLEEWDRLQTLIRLRNRLGWSFQEADMAVTGISRAAPENDVDGSPNAKSVPWTVLKSASTSPVPINITPTTIHHLSDIKSIVELTGLSVEQVLTFWAPLPSHDPSSLFKRLFFSRNLPGNMNLFKPDANGTYFPEPRETISSNQLTIMAALNMTTLDLKTVLEPKETGGLDVEDSLSMENLSQIYRFSLLSRILSIAVRQLVPIFSIFGDPFASPETLLSFLREWTKMQDSGLNLDQIDFLFSKDAESTFSAGPNQKDVLQTCKLLFDGLQDIQSSHKDIEEGSNPSADFLKTKAQMIFDAGTVANILNLTEGTALYSASAPPNLDLKIPPKLAAKLKYSEEQTTDGTENSAKVVISGILTPLEIGEAKALVAYTPTSSDGNPPPETPASENDPNTENRTGGESTTVPLRSKEQYEWAKAIDTATGQPKILMNETISEMFSMTDVPKVLLAPDLTGPTELNDDSSAKTAVQKRLAFLKAFLPRLRQEQSETFIVETLAGLYSLDRDLIDTLLEILHVNTNEVNTSEANISALAAFANLSWKPAVAPDGSGKQVWKGYILPPSTDGYVFFLTSTNELDPSGSEFVLNGQELKFLATPDPLEGGQKRWSSATPVRLSAATLYEFSLNCVKGDSPFSISWKSSRSPLSKIPSSALLPTASQTGTREVFDKLQRCSIVLSQLPLITTEIEYIAQHPEDFAGCDFNSFNPLQWKRLSSYLELRDSLPKNGKSTLIDLFQWATDKDKTATQNENEDAETVLKRLSENIKTLSEKISAVTLWDTTRVSEILKQINFSRPKSNHFFEDFKNEVVLARIKKLIDISTKTNVEPKLLFKWATLETDSTYEELYQGSLEMQKAARSRMDPEFWNETVRPLNDKLRENQRDAMIKYLLVQDVFVNQGISDADALFEFFLIDVQMSPLMETSRIKQAISSVQTFVQRCQLGLEVKSGVDADLLDRPRWDWMKNYRVWEANRKIYLYPENWIDPALRDDKSEGFKALEGELLQNELTKDSISQALRNYVYSIVEVANLITTALFFETAEPFKPVSNSKKLHIWARTRTVPFKYYYRWYSFETKNWYPWEDMQIEIPSYVSEEQPGSPKGRKVAGVHMAPIIWSNRLFVFIPQMTKITVPAPTTLPSSPGNPGNPNPDFPSFSKSTLNQQKPTYAWDIKMSWTEYKDGRWTPRVVSSDGIIHDIQPLPAAETFIFCPMLISPKDIGGSGSGSAMQFGEVKIYAARPSLDPLVSSKAMLAAGGAFSFSGAQLILQDKLSIGISTSDRYYSSIRSFGYRLEDRANGLVNAEVRPYQALQTDNSLQLSFQESNLSPSVVYSDWAQFQCVIYPRGDKSVEFYHKYAPDIMSALQSPAGLDGLYDTLSGIPNADFGAVEGSPETFHELNQPYSLYNWELGLHAPMTLIDRLLKSQQFEDALTVCHYIFNPLASGKSKDASRFWKFPPFKKYQDQSTKTLEEIFMQDFKAGTVNDSVNEWRDKPFQPHVVARSRPKAYMKWVVMKYIEILIAYGDYYFRLNTLETIPNAIQMYVLASHLYGPRGQIVPRREQKPKTYMSLLRKFDAFSNAMVELEEKFPFSNQTPFITGTDIAGNPTLANIYGYANALYFAIPNNPTLVALGTTIDDRLFKIRHCQDIDGVQRLLPLFEPPIDPGLLVQARAQNLSLSTVLANLNAPMPSYRFQYMLNMALELANELKALGNALLSTKEKKDGEALTLLRAKHEKAAQSLLLDVKKLALDEATKSLEAQEYAQKSPIYRLQHYLTLIGADPSSIPSTGSDFQELASMIEKPSEDGSLRLSPYEKEEMDMHRKAQIVSTTAQALELVAAFCFALPNVEAMVAPLGVGGKTVFGPGNVANATQAACNGLKFGAEILNHQGLSAGQKANAQRMLQDRILQANLAGYEVSLLDKQILASKIRVDIAKREIQNQEKAIEQAKEMEDFLKAKFSNVELYSWMEGSVKGLFYSTYTQAYDFAKQAENAFHYERPQDTNTYIQSGYWDPARGGLLSGERLSASLRGLQNAWLGKKGYDYEITKHISLRSLSPLSLISLREAGACTFSIPEALFDLDFPGHYLRRLKSVSITIPAVVGPCTTINATLSLTSHKYRVSSSAAKRYPEELSASPDARFGTSYVPISSIAITSGDNDAGVWNLNFGDEKYIPFEGAGAISSWSLSLPSQFRQFDYTSIADVVMTLKYTSLDGGPALKAAAMDAADKNLKAVLTDGKEGGLYALFDIRNEFSTGWARLLASPSEKRILQLPGLNDRLPLLTRGRECFATEISLISEKELPVAKIGELVDGEIGGERFGLGEGGTSIEGVFTLWKKLPSRKLKIGNWGLSFGEDGDLSARRVWMLVKYGL